MKHTQEGEVQSSQTERGRGGAVVSSSFRGRGTKQQMKYNCQPAHPSSESLVVSSSESSQISFVLSLPHLPNASIGKTGGMTLVCDCEVSCPLVWTPVVPERIGHSTKPL